MFNVTDIFNAVQASVNNEKSEPSGNALYKEILKLGSDDYKDKKVLLRLLPYTKEGKAGFAKTMQHFISYSWKGVTDGKWKNCLSPRTTGNKCSIADYSYRAKNGSSQVEKEHVMNDLFYKEGWYINALVIDDPVNPENNGQVKILRVGSKLHKYIVDVLGGSLDDKWTAQAARWGAKERVEVGKKIFDITTNGVNLQIAISRNNGGYVQYDGEFMYHDENDPKQQFDSARVQEILDSVHDLTKIDKVTTDEENMALFRETFLGLDGSDMMSMPKPKSIAPETSAPTKLSGSDDVLNNAIDDYGDSILADLNLK